MLQQLMLMRTREAVALVVVLVILKMVYVWGLRLPPVYLVCFTTTVLTKLFKDTFRHYSGTVS